MATKNELIRMADEIGVLDAQIAKLEERRDKIADDFKASGYDKIEGEFFDVVIKNAKRTTTAWKKIATQLKASRQLITANTKTTPYKAIQVYGRSAIKEAA